MKIKPVETATGMVESSSSAALAADACEQKIWEDRCYWDSAKYYAYWERNGEFCRSLYMI